MAHGGGSQEVVLNVVDSPPAPRFPLPAAVNSLSSFSVSKGAAAGPVPAIVPRQLVPEDSARPSAVASVSHNQSVSIEEAVKAADSPSREGSLQSDVGGASSGISSPRSSETSAGEAHEESPAQHAQTPNSRKH